MITQALDMSRIRFASEVKKSAEQEIADGIDKVPMPTDDQAQCRDVAAM